MDDDTIKKPILNIDPQKDFNPVAGGDRSISATDWAAKFKQILKDVDFKKVSEEIPLKTMRHDETIFNNTKVILGGYPMDQSGSMSSILHEMPHKIYEKPLEKDYSGMFNKKNIIVFDEFEKDTDAKQSLKEVFAHLSDFIEGITMSRARGEQLAETCHQGIAQPVAVRRPVSFRPRASA